MRFCWLLLLLSAGACLDSTGPRPRPGGPTNGGPGGGAAALLWYELQPRVINQGATDSVTLMVATTGAATSAQVALRTGSFAPLQRGSGGTFSGRLAAADLLFAYHSGDLHHAGGFIEVASDAGTLQQTLLLNVKDGTVPLAAVQTIAAGMQATERVVNIRYDSLYLGEFVPPAVLRTFYGEFPDQFDFVNVVEQVHSANSHYYYAVRNDISGLGLQLFDRGAQFGSTSALQGIVHFPVDAAFDLAETSVLHEIGHRWINFSTHSVLSPARPHWPVSSLAYSVMGRNDPETDEALVFRYQFTAQGDGSYLVHLTETPRTFNDVELYLMGLLPPDSVRPHIVFRNQNQTDQLRENGVLQGPVDSFRISDWIARDGARTPSWTSAQRTLLVATIVLSRGRLLSQHEMSFFEHMAARGETRTPLTYSTGALRATTLPFFLATGGRASFLTRLSGGIQ